LSKDEVEKMKNDAKEHAADDKKKKDDVEVRNQADSLVFQTKKQMEELKDKLPADSKSKLEAEIKKVEEALSTNNSEQIKSATDSLNKSWNEIASKLYSQTNAGQPGAGDPQAEPKQEEENKSKGDDKDVQDASYEVVDDDKDDKKD
jgi:molecular chaperone DnaK